jgi:hypothetical protein
MFLGHLAGQSGGVDTAPYQALSRVRRRLDRAAAFPVLFRELVTQCPFLGDVQLSRSTGSRVRFERSAQASVIAQQSGCNTHYQLARVTVSPDSALVGVCNGRARRRQRTVIRAFAAMEFHRVWPVGGEPARLVHLPPLPLRRHDMRPGMNGSATYATHLAVQSPRF